MSVADILSVALTALSLLVLLPAAVFFIEVAASSFSRLPEGGPPVPSRHPSVAVLMPAHDEAIGIAAAIRAVVCQLREGDRLLVVADNCTDDTASIARALGADVIERVDATRRGKGYALDHGVRALAAMPPCIVVIVDADCEVSADVLGALARQCEVTGRPAQALYLMCAPAGAPLRLRVAEFAWRVKNKVRPTGASVLRWPCQLLGSGMAFPWATLARAPLASGHLVEDMELGIALARSGSAPLFCPEARVSSVFPSDLEGARSQRTRWEHGHLSMIASAGPRLLASAVRRWDSAALALALDLMVPPLAALALSLVAWTIVAAAGWWAGLGAWPLLLSLSGVALVTLAVAIAWIREGQGTVTLAELLMLPVYVVAKIPLYLRWVVGRQTQWIRTKRDERRP